MSQNPKEDSPSLSQNAHSFLNPFERKLKKNFGHFLLWKLGAYRESEDILSLKQDFVYPVSLPSFQETLPSCVWINHATFLIQIENLCILTDPCFSLRCSPVASIGPKRSHPPALNVSDLPSIDFVLISHNHYDHLDKNSVRELFYYHPEIIWIVPLGVKKWFLKRGITKVVEMQWGESFQENGALISSVPAQHFSGRHLLDFNRTLWTGYVVESKGKKFYFSGDTGYNPVDFKKIGEKFSSIDLSLLPIGAYHPRSFMKPVHVNPYEAVLMHQEVRSRFSIGMHWKTFRLADESLQRPPFDLFLAMNEAKLDPNSFIAIEPGIYVNW